MTIKQSTNDCRESSANEKRDLATEAEEGLLNYNVKTACRIIERIRGSRGSQLSVPSGASDSSDGAPFSGETKANRLNLLAGGHLLYSFASTSPSGESE